MLVGGKVLYFGLGVGDFVHIQASGNILRHPKLLCFVFYVLCLLQKIEVVLLIHFCPPGAFQIHCLVMVGLQCSSCSVLAFSGISQAEKFEKVFICLVPRGCL